MVDRNGTDLRPGDAVLYQPERTTDGAPATVLRQLAEDEYLVQLDQTETAMRLHAETGDEGARQLWSEYVAARKR